jgi:hypothetical protein
MRDALSSDRPIIELGQPLAAYLLELIVRDLESWRPDERCGMTREEITAFAEFLHACIADGDRRFKVPAVPAVPQAI